VRSLGKIRHGYEDSNKTNIIEIGWDGVGWIHLAQNMSSDILL
jgi:hypothetical protein